MTGLLACITLRQIRHEIRLSPDGRTSRSSLLTVDLNAWCDPDLPATAGLEAVNREHELSNVGRSMADESDWK